jgi:hypothetical protein
VVNLLQGDPQIPWRSCTSRPPSHARMQQIACQERLAADETKRHRCSIGAGKKRIDRGKSDSLGHDPWRGAKATLIGVAIDARRDCRVG